MRNHCDALLAQTRSMNDQSAVVRYPVGWIFFTAFALSSHVYAWLKIFQTESVDDFAIVNDQTRVCYRAFSLVDQNPWIWLLLILAGALPGILATKRRYNFLTTTAMFLPLYSSTFLYGAGMSYLGGKFLNFFPG